MSLEYVSPSIQNQAITIYLVTPLFLFSSSMVISSPLLYPYSSNLMNSSHYPSLELCKRLTENNFPRTEKVTFIEYNSDNRAIMDSTIFTDFHEDNFLVCPSIAELLDELPTFVEFPH